VRRIDSGRYFARDFRHKYAPLCFVTTPFAPPSNDLPNDLASAHAMILAQHEALIMAQSDAKVRALEIERQKLQLAKARREQFGQSSERGKFLFGQLELAIEDIEEAQAEEETRTEIAVPAIAREKRARTPRGPRKLADNLPVQRIVEPASCACGKCGNAAQRALGGVVKGYGARDAAFPTGICALVKACNGYRDRGVGSTNGGRPSYR
jgi:hypothetical protein